MKNKLKEKILISACLLGVGCRFDGKVKKYAEGLRLTEKFICVPVCPEILAGLSIPRKRVEIQGGSGIDALNGKAKIVTEKGVDVTEKILAASKTIFEFCQSANIKKAVLKEKSPCCGKHFTYDGTFTQKLIRGKGVLAAVLEQNAIEIISEKEI